MNLSGCAAVTALALVQGGLVALPRADALEALARVRSPAWAALLPGSILLGTFGPLALPSMASAIVVASAIATPLLALVAVIGVARGPRHALLVIALVLALSAALVSGWEQQLSATMLTALGCLALGCAVSRLIPPRWVVIGVLAMAGADVLLLAVGVGHTAGALLANADANVHGPLFDQATVGQVSIDYPDLVLAAMLGGFLAGRQQQWAAAVLVFVLAAGLGLLLPIANGLPATVPVALAFLVVECIRFAQLRCTFRVTAPAGAA